MMMTRLRTRQTTRVMNAHTSNTAATHVVGTQPVGSKGQDVQRCARDIRYLCNIARRD
jgi:hypothetical protein